MFKKVLIAEDHETANISVQKTLKDLGIGRTDYAYYCDDAWLRLRKAMTDGDPYELLITDLSFEEDDREQRLKSGEALVDAALALQPELKVLVFSAEQRPAVIAALFQVHGVHGYVRKARRDAQELRAAIERLSQHKLHYPQEFRQVITQQNAHEFTSYDITVITLLAQGVLQKQIPYHLQEKNIRPSGLSSVEKRLNQIRETLSFTKNEQLVAFCKDMGII